MQHTLAVEYFILLVLERFQVQMTRRAIGENLCRKLGLIRKL
jgi:hypothetical protein